MGKGKGVVGPRMVVVGGHLTSQACSRMPVQVGYYCPAGSTSSTQVTCPPGSYCPAAAAMPLSCGPGQYSVSGASLCLPCDAGRYGASAGQSSLCTDACSAGYVAGRDEARLWSCVMVARPLSGAVREHGDRSLWWMLAVVSRHPPPVVRLCIDSVQPRLVLREPAHVHTMAAWVM